MIHTPDKYWRTKNLYLAAFLFGRGAIIVGLELINGRTSYGFIDSLERQTWHDEFRSGTPMIDVRIYIRALQILQEKRYEAMMQQHGEN